MLGNGTNVAMAVGIPKGPYLGPLTTDNSSCSLPKARHHLSLPGIASKSLEVVSNDFLFLFWGPVASGAQNFQFWLEMACPL